MIELCCNCKYGLTDELGDLICCNGNSANAGEFMSDDDNCGMWSKEND